MNLANFHNITNSFQDVQLVSMRTWKVASEIEPRDPGGPYMVVQEGFDPADLTLTPDEFLLGRSGTWLSTKYFLQLPVPTRRAEYLFGTAREIMALLQDLPSKPVVLGPGVLPTDPTTGSSGEPDDFPAVFEAARKEGMSQKRGPLDSTL